MVEKVHGDLHHIYCFDELESFELWSHEDNITLLRTTFYSHWLNHEHSTWLKALDHMLNPPCTHNDGWLAVEFLDGRAYLECRICGGLDDLAKYGSP